MAMALWLWQPFAMAGHNRIKYRTVPLVAGIIPQLQAICNP